MFLGKKEISEWAFILGPWEEQKENRTIDIPGRGKREGGSCKDGAYMSQRELKRYASLEWKEGKMWITRKAPECSQTPFVAHHSFSLFPFISSLCSTRHTSRRNAPLARPKNPAQGQYLERERVPLLPSVARPASFQQR